MRYSPLPEPIHGTQRLVGGHRAPLVLALLVSAFLTPGAATPALASPTPDSPKERAQTMVVQPHAEAPDVRDSFGVVSARESIQYTSGASLAGSSIIWPFAADTVTDGYGERPPPCEGCTTFHGGSDFAGNADQAIVAIADGVVRTVDYPSDFGQRVVVDHVIDGRLVSSLYAHMVEGSPTVVSGQVVHAGDVIGYVGKTGLAHGEHLHLEILLDGSVRTDPVAWLAANAH